MDNLHCHFNVVGGAIGGYQKPLTKEILRDKYICDGKDFLEYSGKRLCGKRGLSRILYFIPILKELEAQYKEFLRITGGAANNKHIDFHLYYNLNFPVAIALNIFTIKYHIRTVRYIGEHLKKSKRMKLLWFLGSNPRTKTYSACNIDYYLQTKHNFSYSDIIELYVHPDMVNNQLLDNSVSEFGNPKRNIVDNIRLLTTDNEINFMSWSQV